MKEVYKYVEEFLSLRNLIAPITSKIIPTKIKRTGIKPPTEPIPAGSVIIL
ncbi:MAG: hypothetical protein M3033_10480 [Acidobacteriota bacterium]|nr:hypothetical protein [Acidobacteriota bacterium]